MKPLFTALAAVLTLQAAPLFALQSERSGKNFAQGEVADQYRAELLKREMTQDDRDFCAKRVPELVAEKAPKGSDEKSLSRIAANFKDACQITRNWIVDLKADNNESRLPGGFHSAFFREKSSEYNYDDETRVNRAIAVAREKQNRELEGNKSYIRNS
jgi:hypothetical protein